MVYVSLQGDKEGYKVDKAEKSAEMVLTINKATATITPDDKSKVKGEADPELTATVTGLVGDDTMTKDVDYALSREPGEDVGTYVISASPKIQSSILKALAVNAENYNVNYETGTFTITALTPDDDEDTPDDNDTTDDGNKTSKKAKADSSKGIKTGDDTDLMGLLGLMAASLAGFIALLFRRRREQD